MAKKAKEMSVEDKLKTLFRLQEVLSGIDEKRALRGELPLEVEDLEDEVAGLATRIEKITRDIDELHQAVVQKGEEIKLAKESVERYKDQLNSVRNNREYDVLTKEIEYQELEIQLCEKKIKEAQVKINERVQDRNRAQHNKDDRMKDLESKRSELDEIMEETRAEEEQLREKAEDLEMRIEPRLLQSFKRIRKNVRNGLGIVYVQRDACGGCFNKIPPQRQLDIKMHKKVIVCEYCGRILIDPELAGVKLTPNGEEKPKKKRVIRKKAAETKTEE
ncbi:MAG: C4-type zinc ribbon domain-containing protein [bacterium]|nr:C4-type zinc ribbon domain-containing protein [Bacteroidales bacterium]MDD7659119.1 C4-type zinc ribbon domain-containing protein [Bacteroidales bacterium]MDO4209443.1 C4-type zinc ribbon domain-containing protein [bacterium]MDY5036388.1 C4-type zinc ribbon domain-containing protein [Prevotella sp.]MDY5066968.1 C4-type zinc ribbon domain-containing protein [Prevotella sp.]